MMNFWLVSVACLCLTCHLVLSVTLGQAMKDHGIVPDIIDSAPQNVIQITYSSGAVVNIGNELLSTQVQDIPTIHYPTEGGVLYTVCMIDLDAPSRANPIFSQWLHWLVINIPEADVVKGEVIDEYVCSNPPKDSGLHRYVFLAYEQPGKLMVDEPRNNKTSENQRNNFKIRDFAKKYNLSDPVAGNFFQVQNN